MSIKKTIAALKRNKGFTLLETLLVVAVLTVLFTISAISVSEISTSLRQKELDRKAETIYVAAQNRISKLRASSFEALYSVANSDVLPLNIVPLDADREAIKDYTLFYVGSQNGVKTATARELLPDTSVSSEIWSEDWIIEYDPRSGSVYAVFYGEEGINYDPNDYNALRRKDYRRSEGAKVGYYGGDSAEIVITETLMPQITVVNAEKLIASFTCVCADDSAVDFSLEVSDGINTVTKNINNYSRLSGVYFGEIVLDSLDPLEKRFHELYPTLNAGANISLKLTVKSTNALIDSVPATVSVNSLFDTLSGTTAGIKAARHLQNLDEGSGLAGRVTAAVQYTNISFADDALNDGDWYSYYGENNFKPIVNPYLMSYMGSNGSGDDITYTAIYALSTVPTAGEAGLFGTFSGTQIKDVRLIGTTINGGSDCGAIAGSLLSDAEITGCRVYLSKKDGNILGKDETDVWLKGNCVGGFVGRIAAGGALSVSNSFAATIAGEGSNYAGGLVGYAAGNVTISDSYADCYLYADTTGGFVAAAGAGANIGIENCYTAGYQISQTNAAGFTTGVLALARNAYSACEYGQTNIGPIFSTAASVTSAERVYYLLGGLFGTVMNAAGTTGVEYSTMSDRYTFAADNLSAAFTGVTGGNYTVVYDLRQQGLPNDYSFPRLANLPHYGDWLSLFESGRLVYFEAYSDNTIGARNTLTDAKTIIGDGYGIVFDALPTVNVNVDYWDDAGVYKSTTIIPSAQNIVSFTSGSMTYYLLKLPLECVNTKYSETYYQQIEINGVSYFYNPHFANTVTESEMMPTSVPEVISIRSARQLYLLTLHYSKLSEATKDSVFTQEIDIDYRNYRWAGYYDADTVSVAEQIPIGKDDLHPFIANYNGGCFKISGISFVSDGLYVGMFGYNRGFIQNVVIAHDYVADGVTYAPGKVLWDNPSILCSDTIEGSGDIVYLGVLAGVNDNIIANCAVTGYSAELHTYRSSTSYIGGLVGMNLDSITNSTANCPYVMISSTFAKNTAGGFVGMNDGSINRCYALGLIEVKKARGGEVIICGFGGENDGVIRNCYSATALIASGDCVSYGFVSAGGSVVSNSCYYLSGGTYRYISKIYSYNDEKGDNRVIGKNSTGLSNFAGLNLPGFGAAATTENFTNTDCTFGSSYPYPAVVRDINGDYIHYGEWTTKADLGFVGVFYWENERTGANAGYHFSYIGVSTDGETVKKDSSLCTAHDDGGIISEFGYGYYTANFNSEAGITVVPEYLGFGPLGVENTEASEQVAAQMEGYIFHAYTVTVDDRNDASKSHMYLDENIANGSIILNVTVNMQTVVRSFAVCPFFADSMSYEEAAPGITDERPYQVRSTDQLQNINWNSENLNSTSRVETANASYNQDFTYLVYIGKAAGSSGNMSSNTAAAGYKFSQTHDIDAQMNASTEYFTPIGSFYDAENGAQTENSEIYSAYFGGSYNGNDYSVQNIEIHSAAQCVGLFGFTLGAHMKNIVLFSDTDGGNVIEANADGIKWYNIGGLIGYAARGTGEGATTLKLENCTVSGYTVRDGRANDGEWGGANIGGIVGATNLQIFSCTAVNTIELALTYSQNYGNIRVGGIVGGCRGEVNSCYTGGKIVNNINVSGTGSLVTNVWVGGIVGGIVMKNSGNLKGIVGSVSDIPYVRNSYTYIELPQDGVNHIKNVQSIASAGEMLSGSFAPITNPDIYVVNCYCYEPNAKGRSDSIGADGNILVEGNLSPAQQNSNLVNQNRVHLNNGGKSPYLQYADMVNPVDAAGNTTDGILLTYLRNGGGSFNRVTTYETVTHATVHGKYSYPGEDLELNGLDYPFATTLTQTDVFGTDAYVHYGEWPKYGMFWQKGRDEIDLIYGYDADEGCAILDTKLTFYDVNDIGAGKPTISFAYDEGVDNGSVELDPVNGISEYDTVNKCFYVRLRILRDDIVNVVATYQGTENTYKADMLLTITAELNVSTSLYEITQAAGRTTPVTLRAFSKKVNNTVRELGDIVTWAAEYNDEGLVTASITGTNADIYSRVKGETSIRILARYTIGAKTYENSMSIIVISLQAGLVGTCNNDTGRFNQVTMLDGNTEGLPKAFSLSEPKPTLSGTDIFLYAGGTDVSISDFVVTQVQAGGDIIFGTHDNDNSRYNVSFGTATTDENYSYKPVYLTGKRTGEINVTITLERAEVTYTLYVQRAQIKTTQINVTFEDGAGNVVSAQTVPYGEPPDMSALSSVVTPTPLAGYHYGDLSLASSWSPAADQPVYKTQRFVPVLLNNHYTLRLNADFGSAAPVEFTREYGRADTVPGLPAEFARSGYDFLGWATESGGAKIYDDQGEYEPPAADGDVLQLYAVWSLKAYRVSVSGNTAYFGTSPSPTTTDAIPGTDLTFTFTTLSYTSWFSTYYRSITAITVTSGGETLVLNGDYTISGKLGYKNRRTSAHVIGLTIKGEAIQGDIVITVAAQ